MSSISRFYTRNEQVSFSLMKISVFLGLVSHCFQNHLGALSVPLYFAILVFGYAGIFLFLSGGHRRSAYVNSFLILIVYFCILGLSRGNLSNFTIAVVQDLRYVMYFLMGAIFAQEDRYMGYFHSIMKTIGVIAIILGVYAIMTFQFGTIATRESTWSDNYFLWWASASSFAYLGAYALVAKKDRLIGLGTFAVFFVLGMLFLKRSALVDVIVIIILSVVVQSSKPIRNLIFTLTGVVFFLIILQRIAPEYFVLTEDALTSRFDNIESVAEVDRNVEAQLYFLRASLADIIFGYGIFNYPDIFTPGEPKNALHLGWANLFFKGGVIYVFWYLWLYSGVVRNLFRVRKSSELFRVCFVVALSCLISMGFEGSWTYTILPFCISAPIFYSARKIA